MRNKQILIVEDDYAMGQLMKDMLSDIGYQTDLCTSAKETIIFLENQNPQLLILDYKLPDHSAAELINLLLEKNISIPPFIISTGKGDEKTAVQMMKLGAFDYIIKEPSMFVKLPDYVKKTFQSIEDKRKLEETSQALILSEKKLQEEKKRIANIIEGTKIGTWEWDLQSGVLKINEQWANIIGYSLKELEPVSIETWKSFVNLEDQKAGSKMLESYFSGKLDFYDLEIRMRHKEGHWVWVQERGCIVQYTYDQMPLVMAGTIQNIHAKKEKEKLEKEIILTRKALEFKQNFLASMSHEIKTPLSAAIGIINLLETKPEHLQTYLPELKKSAQNLNEIINQLIDFANIEWGKIHLNMTTFSLSTLIKETASFYKEIIESKAITFTYSQENNKKIIKGDFQKLKQVMSNILLYSSKLPDVRKVRICVKTQYSDSSEMHQQATISICNDGTELTSEQQKQLFTAFAHSQLIHSDEYKGMNLVMPLCKEILNIHNGELTYTKTQEWNNIFEIKIPISRQKDLHHCETSLKARILLAEDQEITGKVVKLLLEEEGHRITLVKNGKQAVETYKPQNFDLILLDIQMPIMDGRKACALIRKNHPKPCPIIAFSANIIEANQNNCLDWGFDDFIAKPLEIETFNCLLKKHLPSDAM